MNLMKKVISFIVRNTTDEGKKHGFKTAEDDPKVIMRTVQTQLTDFLDYVKANEIR